MKNNMKILNKECARLRVLAEQLSYFSDDARIGRIVELLLDAENAIYQVANGVDA